MTRKLGDFFGSFTLSRVIEDAQAGQSIRFSGEAVIEARDGGALYREQGELALPDGQAIYAERRYLWRADGRRVAVLFEDGRAFHDFDPETGGLASEHLCGQDMYRGGYDFSEWSCWAVTWDVKGPRKAYRSVTWYVRR